MILISNIKLSLSDSEDKAIRLAKRKLKLSDSEIADIWIHKTSLDARKGDIKFVYSVGVNLVNARLEKKFASKDKDIAVKNETKLDIPLGTEPMKKRPVVCGFGPAGFMAALVLAKKGFAPIVIEQGEDIDKRRLSVKAFEQNGILNPDSNVQFGEGGAGTFSDGKLTTRISDERCSYVIDTFIENGAPVEIAKKAKPHIGTDLLGDVIKNIRQQIIDLGGSVYFGVKMTDLYVADGHITGINTTQGDFETDTLILACGHSARDVFDILSRHNADMRSKAFSVGVRIEHLQSEIEKSLYHDLAGNDKLPKGEYQLSYTGGDRGVYTFCMCPGGYVMAAASQPDTVVVNGMSYHARDGKNSNSALVVSVTPDDYGTDYRKALDFQISLEKKAFSMGGGDYKAPCQTLGNYILGKAGIDTQRIQPTYPLGVKEADLNLLLPGYVNDSIKNALPYLDRKLNGFAAPDAVLTGVESRTSSPVRVERRDNFQSNILGMYPCGEGAGYAGGIMSACVDGVRVAEYICRNYRPDY